MSSSASDLPLRFGEFEILPTERVLRARGGPVAIGGRAFDLLLCLAQRRDRLVSKQELLDLVWPGLIVEEHNIATQIGTLRKLLGPHIITTVPGRGYRLTAPVYPADAAAFTTAALRDASPNGNAAPSLRPLLGREDDLAALAGMVQRYRLVTVVGAGGIGKSLLARHFLAQHGTQGATGTCWVELASISDAALLPSRIAESLGVQLASADPSTALCAATAGLNVLLALDNAEHLSAGVAPLVAALIDAAPGMRLLVTSQAPLQVAGEGVYRLGPLAVPPRPLPAELAQTYASVALFVQRARDADAHFAFGDAQAAAAIEICHQLDGLPLAIELAAARAPLLGLRRLNAMMHSRLQLLTRSRDSQAPARQQTLRAALEWSHGFLGPTLRTVFRRLGVIVDSASLTFIEQIVADEAGELDTWAVLDALGTLVDRSLVVVMPSGEGEQRYRLLETPRAFALELLDVAGEREMMRRRHATVLAAQFDAAHAERWSGRIRFDRWEAGVNLDAHNARAALAWAQAADEPAIAAGIVTTLYRAMPNVSIVAERIQIADLCMSLAERLESGPLRLRLLVMAAMPMRLVSQEQSLQAGRAARALARTLDRDAPDRWPLYQALCTSVFGMALAAQPRLDELRQLIDEIDAIEDAAWPPHRLGEGWYARALVRMLADDPAREADLLHFTRHYIHASQASGADVAGRVSILVSMHLAMGYVQAAIELGELELARLADSRDEWCRFLAHTNQALALLLLGETQRARPLMVESRRIAPRDLKPYCSDQPPLLAALEGRPRAAARLMGHSDAQYASLRNPTREPAEQSAIDRCAALVRAVLGDAATDALMVKGRDLSDDQVEALAFAEQDLG